MKLKHKEVHNSILSCLSANIDKTKAIGSVFMLDYLLESFPEHQIKSLITPELQKLQTFLKHMENKEFDLKSFNEINSNEFFSLNVSKRPRLSNDCNTPLKCKFILNEMLDYSRQLVNTTAAFDNHDYEILNCIQDNIQQCLLKRHN